MRAILTYHSIDPSGSVISVDEVTFRRHAEWLAESPTPVVEVDELLSLPAHENAVAVVFDDAFENFETTAWPLMRDLGLPATVFVVTRQVGGTNAWHGQEDPIIPTLPLMDWDAVGRMAAEGVTIGSHTRSHPRLDQMDDARLEDEVRGAADDLEARLGVRPSGFAYPYGDFDARAESAVSATHAWACSAELATLGANPPVHRLPRLDAFYYRRPGQLEAWGTRTFRARLSVRRAARDARRWASERGLA